MRNPLDVTVSYAHHLNWSVARTIEQMNSWQAQEGLDPNGIRSRLPEPMTTWSNHALSWIEQAELPVHVARYEDLLADPRAGFGAIARFAGLEWFERRARHIPCRTRRSHRRGGSFSELSCAGAPTARATCWATTPSPCGDQRKRVLFCARDHIGARPLYYAHENGQFAFASAVEAVLANAAMPDALDETMVATHLGSTRCSDTRTFFRAVRKLPPGHTLTVEASPHGWATARVRMAGYWFPEQAPLAKPTSDDACIEQFLHLYEQAVRDRCAGGPVGTHLSGGLDSSSIAVLAARELRRQGRPPPLAFTWLPGGDTAPKPAHAPEYALVDAVCQQEKLQVCHGAPSAEDLLALLALDGALPHVHVHVNEEIVQRNAQARGVKVLLSGWGGDECVSYSGAGHHQQLLLSGRWRQLAAERRAAKRPLLRFLAGVALPLLLPSLPAALRQLRTGRTMRPSWFIDPTFARRVKPLATADARTIGCGARSCGGCGTGIWPSASKGGPRAAPDAASSIAIHCSIAACWSSPWDCRRSDSSAASGIAG